MKSFSFLIIHVRLQIVPFIQQYGDLVAEWSS